MFCGIILWQTFISDENTSEHGASRILKTIQNSKLPGRHHLSVRQGMERPNQSQNQIASMRFQLFQTNPQTLRASNPSRPPYERPARIRRTLIKFAHHDKDIIQIRNTSKIIKANQHQLIITIHHYHFQIDLREAHQQHPTWCHWQDMLQTCCKICDEGVNFSLQNGQKRNQSLSRQVKLFISLHVC